MVYYRTGNIFEQTDLYAIAHQANCYKQMGAGFVVELCRRFPEVREVDNSSLEITCDADMQKKLGTFSTVCVDSGELARIYNVYSQGHWCRGGCNTDYDAIVTAFTAIKDILTTTEKSTGKKIKLGVPHFYGSGLGGGNWWQVDKIFNDIFNDGSIDLIICRL